MESRNRIVANALASMNAAGVRVGSYEVTLETVDFGGNRTQTKTMTDAQLRSWLGLVRCGGVYAEAMERFGRGERHYDANVDMHPTVRIRVRQNAESARAREERAVRG